MLSGGRKQRGAQCGAGRVRLLAGMAAAVALLFIDGGGVLWARPAAASSVVDTERRMLASTSQQGRNRSMGDGGWGKRRDLDGLENDIHFKLVDENGEEQHEQPSSTGTSTVAPPKESPIMPTPPSPSATATPDRTPPPTPAPLPLYLHYHVTHHAGTTVYKLAKHAGVIPSKGDGRNGIFNIGTRHMRSWCDNNPKLAPACVPWPNATDVAPDAFACGDGATGMPTRVTFAGGISRAWQLERWRTNTTSLDHSWHHEHEVDPDGPMRQWVSIEMPMYAFAWSAFPRGDGPRLRISTMTAVRHPLGVIASAYYAYWHDNHTRTEEKVHDLTRLLEPRKLDNYATRWFSGNTDFGGVPLSERDFQRAADRLLRFENVAVVEALADTLRFWCDDWGLSKCDPSVTKTNVHHFNIPKAVENAELSPPAAFPAQATTPGRKAAERLMAITGLNASMFGEIVELNAPSFRLYDIGVEMARSSLRARGQTSDKLEAIPADSLEEARVLAEEWLAHEAESGV